MIKLIKWFFGPSKKPIVEDIDLYAKIVEMENRIAKLEEENVETSNTLYELMNSLDAVDARIDILTLENWNNKNV
jgi:septal ring factor EnvC (AmiA/AmiB activator)